MNEQLTLRLPRELYYAVSQEASKKGLSRADIVRLAIRRYLGIDTQGPAPRPYDRVRDLVGSLDSGIPDLGSDHRKHLKRGFGGRT